MACLIPECCTRSTAYVGACAHTRHMTSSMASASAPSASAEPWMLISSSPTNWRLRCRFAVSRALTSQILRKFLTEGM